jgi:hypothetical protein
MTHFRIDISRETETVVLYMESACGFRPLIGWSNMDGVKEFAEMLLDIYHHDNREQIRIREISDNILKQVIGNNMDLLDEETPSN